MISPCSVIPPKLYRKLAEQGWEWEEKSRCLHFDCLVGEDDGIGFDAYIEKEIPLEITLYFTEYSILGKDYREFRTESIVYSYNQLLLVTRPYLCRGFEHNLE